MLEADIERYAARRVKAMGGEIRKVAWVGRRNAPDRVIWLPRHLLRTGRYSTAFAIWVEFKRPGEKPRIGQLREHVRMRNLGQCVVVIDSLAGVEELLS